MIELSSENGSIQISGNIKSIDDYLAIKSSFQELVDAGHRKIDVSFVNSVSITSSVIGFMLKLVNVDKVDLNVYAGDRKLIALMEELDLQEVFKVQSL
jgi:adenosine deaminase